MKFVCLVMTAVGLLISDQAETLGGKSDKKSELQGTWNFVSMTKYGQAVKELDGAKFTVDGDKLFIWGPPGFPDKNTPVNRVSLNQTTKPKHFDTLKLKGGEVEWRGIYKIEGDTLTICCTVVGNEGKQDKLPDRPSEFVSRGCTPVILFVLKRVKE